MYENVFKPINLSIRKNTLKDVVFNSILDAILEGKIPPGNPLNQLQIAEKLNVSRGPVREALAKLEEMGLVESIEFRGSFIVDITPHYVHNLFEARRVIEGYAISESIDRAQQEEIDSLRNIVLTEISRQSNTKENPIYDLNFHYLICEFARNEILLMFLKSMDLRLRHCLVYAEEAADYSTPEEVSHLDILNAIETRDKQYATDLLRKHLNESEFKIIKSIETMHLESEHINV